MEKKVEISMLLQIYGELLTEKQYKVMDYYYNEDLSLSEIAENEKITRQGVRDIIKKGEKKLFEYEEKLLFMKKTINQEKLIQNILVNLNKVQKVSSDKKVSNILEEVKEGYHGIRRIIIKATRNNNKIKRKSKNNRIRLERNAKRSKTCTT